MKKKNLVFFLPNYSPGGAGKSILNICKYLNKKKYNIFIISIGKNYYKKILNVYCAKIIEIEKSSTLISLNKIKKHLNILKKENTILISNINYANALFVLYFKIIYNFKLILVERTPLQELFIYFGLKDFIKKLIIKFIVKYFYRYADEIVANSKKTAKDFSFFTKKKCLYIYPLTIDKLIMSKKKILKKNELNLLTIGRLSKEKNILEQLKALSILKDKNFFLYILGDGAEKKGINMFIKRNKLNAKIIRYSDKIKHKLLKNCNLYICSSLFEGFPNAIVDALNYNTPVISSKNHGGIKEIILNKRGGELYDVGNQDQLAKKIFHISKNYNSSIKKTFIAKKFLKRFTKKNIEKYENLFDKI